MPFTIDPSKASVDFDCMTLDKYSIESEASGPDGEDGTPTIATVYLSGGLGRIEIANLGSHFTENDISVETSGLFPALNSAQQLEMADLFERWRALGTPLRFLLFSEKAVLLENSDQFIIFPPGVRKVNVGTGDS